MKHASLSALLASSVAMTAPALADEGLPGFSKKSKYTDRREESWLGASPVKPDILASELKRLPGALAAVSLLTSEDKWTSSFRDGGCAVNRAPAERLIEEPHHS
ncbi:hypothetical protein NQT62_09905 [Limnobacter humi]|uniref:Uncharacterized protein n=1 Tax=Limnobacter humi TaxID=1778671 RepID=A0ABT1WGU8_9BURK|nr:hypothetical protein [Limnobacter humi]MCQ8896745.1 hypothetical protein [Limnobacter humi]